MQPIIRVDNLSKQYRIGRREPHRTLRETVTDAMSAPYRRLNGMLRSGNGGNDVDDDTIWALKDVSFDVMPGEVVGVIGRNGAGKSTLLKILSRITGPTSGGVDLHGRVASLLEVGTGFHPELTGRENVYLNGAILGMRKAEIERKFDEIVAFAEIEKFLDTPVKRYSSGMYVRLAFAVAAHLDPEILLIDEVLAVGDGEFQKKCIGKMDDVSKQGRTVLFVSHNMSAIGKLCSRVICFEGGGVMQAGESRSVIAHYMTSAGSVVGHRDWADLSTAPGDDYVRAISVSILDEHREPVSVLHQDVSFIISLVYRVLKPMRNANVGFELRAEDGTTLFTSFDADNRDWSNRGRKRGVYSTECIIPGHLLNEGTYYFTLLAGIPFFRLCMRAEDVLRLIVEPSVSGDGPAARIGARRPGVISPELSWHVSFAE
jgi:homopolymeric O-antigen transport system ATP-binding protein